MNASKSVCERVQREGYAYRGVDVAEKLVLAPIDAWALIKLKDAVTKAGFDFTLTYFQVQRA